MLVSDYSQALVNASNACSQALNCIKDTLPIIESSSFSVAAEASAVELVVKASDTFLISS